MTFGDVIYIDQLADLKSSELPNDTDDTVTINHSDDVIVGTRSPDITLPNTAVDSTHQLHKLINLPTVPDSNVVRRFKRS